jgi:hypothetical protein
VHARTTGAGIAVLKFCIDQIHASGALYSVIKRSGPSRDAARLGQHRDQRARRRVFLDHIGALLTDHHHGRVGVAGNEGGHDRAVDHLRVDNLIDLADLAVSGNCGNMHYHFFET